MKFATEHHKFIPKLHELEAEGSRRSVVIIGGGVAGAYAAWNLSRMNFDVTVLSKDVGRLRTVSSLTQQGELNLGGMRFPASHRFVASALQLTGLNRYLQPFVNYNENGRLVLRGHNVRFADYHKLADAYGYDGDDPVEVFSQAMDDVLRELGSKHNELALEQALRAGHRYGFQTLSEYLALQGYNMEQIAYIGHVNSVYPYVNTPIGELAIDYSSLYGNKKYFRLARGLVMLPQTLLQQSGARVIHSATVTTIDTELDVTVEYHTPEGMRTIAADYVINTAPAPAIARMRWQKPLPAKQVEAFREVGYASSSKTLIESVQPFWLMSGIDGGRNWTDLEIQQSVFPRGIKHGQVSVFTASYTWQDSARKMMALSDPEERFELIAERIDQIHPGARKYLRRYEHIDWDAASGGGAFAYYAPGDYERFHTWLSVPFPEQDPKVFFAGECVGLHHGWAESALQSAQWAILNLLDAMSA